MEQDVLHGLECVLLVKSGYQPSTPTAWLLLRAWLRSEYEEEEGGEEVKGAARAMEKEEEEEEMQRKGR